MTQDMSRTELEAFLERHRQTILDAWVDRLHTGVSEKYSGRPTEELVATVTDAFDGNRSFLIDDDPSQIDRFIESITRLRLSAGFSLSHVQTAFELFREIVTPMLFESFPPVVCHPMIVRVNQCMAYVVKMHSELFQAMHEKTIRQHNLELKWKVQRRTAELAESERKYKTLVEEINDGYVVVRDEMIVFANPAFAKIHQWSESAVIGQRFLDFVAPESREKILTLYNRGMIIGKQVTPKAFEYMRLTRDGNTYPTEILSRITHYDDQLATIAICRDITERVRMEKKVREAERMATIGQITASLSHEIRNPLSAIKLNLQVLKKKRHAQGQR